MFIRLHQPPKHVKHRFERDKMDAREAWYYETSLARYLADTGRALFYKKSIQAACKSELGRIEMFTIVYTDKNIIET